MKILYGIGDGKGWKCRPFLDEGRKRGAAGTTGGGGKDLLDRPAAVTIHYRIPHGDPNHSHVYQQGREILDEVIERSLLPARRAIPAQVFGRLSELSLTTFGRPPLTPAASPAALLRAF